jgi:hypothetical protein
VLATGTMSDRVAGIRAAHPVNLGVRHEQFQLGILQVLRRRACAHPSHLQVGVSVADACEWPGKVGVAAPPKNRSPAVFAASGLRWWCSLIAAANAHMSHKSAFGRLRRRRSVVRACKSRIYTSVRVRAVPSSKRARATVLSRQTPAYLTTTAV